jgi:acyl-CoA thioester hydrolase
MYTHRYYSRVRYAETDKMGYLYYGNYATYYEIGRVEAMREIGVSYKTLEDKLGIAMPVMSLKSKFIRPATYDDLICIQTEIRKMPDMDITFHMELFNEKDQLINYGEVKLCFIQIEFKTRVPIPDIFIQKLKPYFEKKEE